MSEQQNTNDQKKINGDILLKGGHLIDPKNNINEKRDILIKDGKILKITKSVHSLTAEKVIDLGELIITPGLVDIHTHLFHTTGIPNAWAGDYSVSPDSFSFRSGTTTMVDAGSSGWRNFELFKTTVIDRVQTRVLAYINNASYGMVSDMIEQYESDFDSETTSKMAEKHKDIIVGIKTAHYFHPDWIAVDKALETGRKANLPIMVDFGYFRKERPYWKLVSERLRPGDISTHCFRGSIPYTDENGRIYEYLVEAQQRGIIFDVGHGMGSFIFRNAVPATEQEFYPDSISTDIHVLSMNHALIDMQTTMSKFLAMGMPLEELILRSTYKPAQIINHTELGHLSEGAIADIAVWDLKEGSFGYKDSAGGRIEYDKRLFCEMTLKDGNVMWDRNARDSIDYKLLSPTCGNRDGLEFIVHPPK